VKACRILLLFFSFPGALVQCCNYDLAVKNEYIGNQFATRLLSDETIEIIGYNGFETNVVVPETINGVVVTSISSRAFSGNRDIISVNIPDSVKSIASCTFQSCDNLEEVVLPNGLIEIPQQMFHDCKSLTSIDIPESVITISANAFLNCSRLPSVVIPQGVTVIENNAFQNCSSLNSVSIPRNVTVIEPYTIMASRTYWFKSTCWYYCQC